MTANDVEELLHEKGFEYANKCMVNESVGRRFLESNPMDSVRCLRFILIKCIGFKQVRSDTG